MSTFDLSEEIERIAALDLAGLRALWSQRYETPPPLRSVAILRQILAWRLQAEVLGGLERDTMRALRRKGRTDAEGLHLGIGARLTRTWQGRRVEVIVERDGFRWGEQLFPSLSAAASAIAGSRWNGPRFFGLRADT